MTESIEERALRIAAETNVSQPDGCGSCDEWTIEFARRLWAEQPICACGDSFTDEAMCINCIASTPSLHGEQGEPVKYGCHCDIEETKTRQPAECVFDNGDICDCFYAACLQKEGKGKMDCEYYRPIAPPFEWTEGAQKEFAGRQDVRLEQQQGAQPAEADSSSVTEQVLPASPANGATIVRTGEHNGGPYDMNGGVDDEYFQTPEELGELTRAAVQYHDEPASPLLPGLEPVAWIDVSERLPAYQERVLIARMCSNGQLRIEIGYVLEYTLNDRWSVVSEVNFECVGMGDPDVRYWQPLPQKPAIRAEISRLKGEGSDHEKY